MARPYPPPDQVLSAFGIEVAWVADDVLRGRTAVDVDLLGGTGRPPSMGHLVAVLDLVAGTRAIPMIDGDWMATSDVMVVELAPFTAGPIELATDVVRAGKRSMVVGVEVAVGGRPVVDATVGFSRIRREATNHSAAPTAPAGEWRRVGSGPLLDQPIETACGFEVIDADGGVVEVARAPFVNNSIGTLQGGVVGLLGDAAARAIVGPGSRVVDLHMRFLAQTGDGPARTSAAVLRRDDQGTVVRVEIVDLANDALVGLAVCRVDGGS